MSDGFVDYCKFGATRSSSGRRASGTAISPYRSPFAICAERTIVFLLVRRADDDTIWERGWFRLEANGELSVVQITENYLFSTATDPDAQVSPLSFSGAVECGGTASQRTLVGVLPNGTVSNAKEISNTVIRETMTQIQDDTNLEDGQTFFVRTTDHRPDGGGAVETGGPGGLFIYDESGGVGPHNGLTIFSHTTKAGRIRRVVLSAEGPHPIAQLPNATAVPSLKQRRWVRLPDDGTPVTGFADGIDGVEYKVFSSLTNPSPLTYNAGSLVLPEARSTVLPRGKGPFDLVFVNGIPHLDTGSTDTSTEKTHWIVQGLASTPPVAPSQGQVWLIGDSATDAWAGQDGNIAIANTGGTLTWEIISGSLGLTATDVTSNTGYAHDGTTWVSTGTYAGRKADLVDGKLSNDQTPDWLTVAALVSVRASGVGGTADAIMLAVNGGPSLADGLELSFLPSAESTGPITINYNVGGAVDLLVDDAAALSGALLPTTPVTVRYDAAVSKWRLISGGGGGPTTPNALPGTEITIASGIVTPTRASHILAAESGTSDSVTSLVTTPFKDLAQGSFVIKATHNISFVHDGSAITCVSGATIVAAGGDIVDWKCDEAGTGVIISKRTTDGDIRSLLGEQASVAAATTELAARYGSTAAAPVGVTFSLNDATSPNHLRIFVWIGDSWIPSSPESKAVRYVFTGGGADPSYYLIDSELNDTEHLTVFVGGALATGFTLERGDWTASGGGAATRIIPDGQGGGTETGDWVASATGDDVRITLESGDTVGSAEKVTMQALEGITAFDGVGDDALNGATLTGVLRVDGGEILSAIATETYTVGPTGDYASFQAAFDAELTRVRPKGQQVDLVAQAGFQPTSGIICANGDFGHIFLKSTDAILTLSSSFGISDAPFIRATNAVAPVLACLVNANGRASKGYDLYGSRGRVLAGCGVTDAYGSGLHADDASTVSADLTVWDRCAQNGVTGHCIGGLKASSVAADGASAEDSGYYGAQAAWGGSLSISDENGVTPASVDGAFRYGLRVTDGGIISANAITARNCGQGSGVGNALRAFNQGFIMARDAILTGCDGQAPISCSGAGAAIHAQDADLSGNLSNDEVVATQTGIVNIVGATTNYASPLPTNRMIAQSGARIINTDGSVYEG